MKKRVAFLRSKYLPPSETFIYEELKNIRKFKPIVFCRKRMNLRRFPYKPIRKLPKSPKKTARLWRKMKIRLIHARFGTMGVKVMKAKKIAKLPMITSFHGFDLPHPRSNRKTYQRKLRRLFRVGEKFTVPSRHAKRRLIKWGCPAHKIKIMYSGIDMNKFKFSRRSLRKKRVRIISVGRLHKKKGMEYLIKAFRKVHKSHPSTKLVIIGSGDERLRLKRMVKKYRLKRHVQFKGNLPHRKVAKELRKADIFCLPSVTAKNGNQEGIPNAIKEAMATGLPVVSTRHGGIPELVTNGKEGFLVPERSVKQLSKKLNHLITHPQLRIKMGKKGRKKVERFFNSKKQVRILEALYKSVLKKRGK